MTGCDWDLVASKKKGERSRSGATNTFRDHMSAAETRNSPPASSFKSHIYFFNYLSFLCGSAVLELLSNKKLKHFWNTFCFLKIFCPSMPVNFHLGSERIPRVHASCSRTASRWLLNYRFGDLSYTFSDFAAIQLPVISATAYKDGINSSVPQINLCWQTAWTA